MPKFSLEHSMTNVCKFRFGPYFIVPVVAGLDKKEDGTYEPVIASYDYIG